MKKILIATIIMGISMNLVGCNKSMTSVNEDTVNSKITMEQAKEIALKHANLTSDQVSFIKEGKDIYNGIEKYDIEFYHENKEYDYEINAANGEIIEYDHEIENHNIEEEQASKNESSEIAKEQTSDMNKEQSNEINKQQSNEVTKEQTQQITKEKAKEIALKHMNLASDQVTFDKVELDVDDGIQKYDVEFYYNNKEYNYEIDANTGNILSYEQD